MDLAEALLKLTDGEVLTDCDGVMWRRMFSGGFEIKTGDGAWRECIRAPVEADEPFVMVAVAK